MRFNRSFFLLLSLIVLPFISMAEELTPVMAWERAFPYNLATRSSVLKEPITLKDNQDRNTIYLFELQSEGIAIVSADDVAIPVLGILNSKHSEDPLSNPSLKDWLNSYTQEIEAARELNITPSKKIPERDSKVPIPALCKSRWGQFNPFNSMCPIIEGKYAPAGCVATAMAQIMYHFKYPEHGTGVVTYTDWRGVEMTMDMNVKFDWSNMIEDYTHGYDKAQENAVALLMKACGYGCKMYYRANESASSDVSAMDALRDYFGYDKSMRADLRINYPLKEWESMVYDNLAQGCPLLYSGTNGRGGHEFICDGYSENGYFHFNFGWNGDDDGFFRLSALNYDDADGIILANGYNVGQMAVFGIRPDTGAPIKQEAYLSLYGDIAMPEADGSIWIQVSAMNNSVSDLFDLGLDFYPIGSMSNTEHVCFSIGGQAINIPVGYSWPVIGVAPSYFANKGVAPGDYKCYPVYRCSGDKTWKKLKAPLTNVNYCIAHVTEASITVESATNPMMEIEVVTMPTDLSLDIPMSDIEIKISNKSDQELVDGIQAVIMKKADGATDWSLFAIGPTAFADLIPGEKRDARYVNPIFIPVLEEVFDTTAKYALSFKSLYRKNYLYFKEPFALSINGSGIKDIQNDINFSVSGRPRIYSIDGKFISDDINQLESLPSGIYIINGEKILKQN